MFNCEVRTSLYREMRLLRFHGKQDDWVIGGNPNYSWAFNKLGFLTAQAYAYPKWHALVHYRRTPKRNRRMLLRLKNNM